MAIFSVFFPFHRVSLSRFNFIPCDNLCERNVISFGESFKKMAFAKRKKHLTRRTGRLALMVTLLYFTFLGDVCMENVQFSHSSFDFLFGLHRDCLENESSQITNSQSFSGNHFYLNLYS